MFADETDSKYIFARKTADPRQWALDESLILIKVMKSGVE